jgi:hypothetical protein
MPIDTKKLLADASRLAEQRGASQSRGRTGATEIVTAALPEIKELREHGFAWSTIAAALARQGAVQGVDRKPLTGRRLCALLSAIDKREERRARKRRLRHARRDVVSRQGEGLAAIAPELKLDTCHRTSALSESHLRVEAFAELKSLMKVHRK